MKKLILIALMVSAFTHYSNAQQVVNGCIVTLKDQPKSDTISAVFHPTEYAWTMKLSNNLQQDISVVWDKSSFILNGASSKIIFDNTLKVNIDNPIPDQEIPAGSFVEKKIFPSGRFTKRWADKTIDKKEIRTIFKETGNPANAKIILAVKANGEIKKYDFLFEITPKQ